MRESLSLASIYKKIQSLEQKQILKYELKLENNEVRLLTKFDLRSQERIVNGQEFQSLFPIQKGFSFFSMMRCLMMSVIFSNKYRDNVWS